MILINFSHPLTEEQIAQVNSLSDKKVTDVIDLPVQFVNDQPFLPQLEVLMEKLPLSSVELQTEPIIVNPPALNYIAALLLAHLHGRMGYFPAIIRLHPAPNSLPTSYAVAEILNLQAVRDASRKERF